MKTTKLTKKDIRAIVRTENATAIFQACKTVTGSASYCAVRKFIEDYAPTAALRAKAYSLSYGAARNQRPANEDQETKARQFRNGNRRHVVMQLFRSELARGLDSYTKRPVMGHTRLYFAAPAFGHSDYNKRAVMDIRGNERFCELICRVADRIYIKK